MKHLLFAFVFGACLMNNRAEAGDRIEIRIAPDIYFSGGYREWTPTASLTINNSTSEPVSIFVEKRPGKKRFVEPLCDRRGHQLCLEPGASARLVWKNFMRRDDVIGIIAKNANDAIIAKTEFYIHGDWDSHKTFRIVGPRSCH